MKALALHGPWSLGLELPRWEWAEPQQVVCLL
jgi:hypothetical protein